MDSKRLRVQLIRSPAGTGKRQIACVRGLGLRRLRHTVEVADTPAIRGIIRKVAHLVHCEEV